MKKKYLLISLLFIAIGFAAVSTTLLINGTANLVKNSDDFKVYYSDALVNGTQDLSVVVDETHLSFKTTLDTLGQTYVLDYDVTNSSKNYDAQLTMNCTDGNEYLTVVNSFDTSSNLLATNTRSGKLTLTLAKSYTGNDLDVEITCTLGASAVERNSMATGTPKDPVQGNYAQTFCENNGYSYAFDTWERPSDDEWEPNYYEDGDLSAAKYYCSEYEDPYEYLYGLDANGNRVYWFTNDGPNHGDNEDII